MSKKEIKDEIDHDPAACKHGFEEVVNRRGTIRVVHDSVNEVQSSGGVK